MAHRFSIPPSAPCRLTNAKTRRENQGVGKIGRQGTAMKGCKRLQIASLHKVSLRREKNVLFVKLVQAMNCSQVPPRLMMSWIKMMTVMMVWLPRWRRMMAPSHCLCPLLHYQHLPPSLVPGAPCHQCLQKARIRIIRLCWVFNFITRSKFRGHRLVTTSRLHMKDLLICISPQQNFQK
ncbi:hypothetical protein KSP39_PZI008741 [Platanthera zijinensis]|uniref:Uncharacterized protein n=1 Tax=Platanthera zijinensis TaxID=2320716 RepID=A0AAP0BMR2_9ASPA